MITISDVRKELKKIYVSIVPLEQKQLWFNNILEQCIDDFSKYGDVRVRGILAEMKGFTQYMIAEKKKK